MDVASLVPVANRDGLFVVVSPTLAKTVRGGYMKLYADGDLILVETITRARKNLLHYGEYRVVLIGVDQDGRLTLS